MFCSFWLHLPLPPSLPSLTSPLPPPPFGPRSGEILSSSQDLFHLAVSLQTFVFSRSGQGGWRLRGGAFIGSSGPLSVHVSFPFRPAVIRAHRAKQKHSCVCFQSPHSWGSTSDAVNHLTQSTMSNHDHTLLKNLCSLIKNKSNRVHLT